MDEVCVVVVVVVHVYISVVLLSPQCTAVERECVGLEGLYDVVSACHEVSTAHTSG